MSDKTKILIQLDSDAQPSVFDRVVAIDAGVTQLFAYGGVTFEQVQGLVHGAMFTRGPADLAHTAIFIGGSNVTRGEEILARAVKTFFGPLRVSVMLDANGANTTAAAAVIAAGKHINLASAHAVVLGGTGPVGQRATRLLALEGASIRLASRTLDRATMAAAAINAAIGVDSVRAVSTETDRLLADALHGANVVIAAGAAGARLLPAAVYHKVAAIKVAIDLNAVPPAGIEGIEAMDKATDRQGVICYGPMGVGGMKMKIHKAAINSLFEANDRVLDAEAIYALGKAL